MKFLVTGGAGFIGSNIVEALVKKKYKVRVIDNFCTGKMDNIKPFLPQVELVRGDIRKSADVKKALRGIDYVLHQAALRSVPRSVDDPLSNNDVNITGTLNVLYNAKLAGVKRVVYASSSSVYGDNKQIPQKETLLTSPISPYAVSKLAGENYCMVYAKTMGLEAVALRYFNVFGPRQDPKSKYSAVIPLFMHAALTDKQIIIHGDGKQSRDFSYIDNVVNANILAALTPGVSGQIFNIACNQSNAVIDIVLILERILHRKLNKKHVAPRKGDIRETCADITKAKKLLKYKPTIMFEEGIEKTFEWVKTTIKG